MLGVQADITRQEDVDRLFAQTLETYGRLDILVNNAGRSMRGKLLQTTPEQFRELMELNLIALVRCTLSAVPHLLLCRGDVVNIGSLAAKLAARWVVRIRRANMPWPPILSNCAWSWNRRGCTCCSCAQAQSRPDQRLYPLAGLADVPESARRAGAGPRARHCARLASPKKFFAPASAACRS